MDVAQVLIAIVGLGAAVTTYCLMRFPHMRREQFRHYGAVSYTHLTLPTSDLV